MRALRHQRPTEDDGLQTDVMRFMAIIAFCLVAVLALVKDVSQNVAQDVRTEVLVDAPPPPPARPVKVKPAPVRTPDLEPRVEVAQPVAPEVSEPAPEPVAPAPAVPETGLVLRFASDADFLQLVRSGKVRLFALQPEGQLVLDRGFTFRDAQAPGEVHELETVPARVRAALPDLAATPRWAVRLPRRTREDIQRLADRHASGQLIIDRTGGVRHAQNG